VASKDRRSLRAAVRLRLFGKSPLFELLSSGWTRRACLDPTTRGGNELFVREWWKCAHRAVRTATGIPGPLHERFFFVMLQQTWTIEIVIPRAIGYLPTDSRTRKRAIVNVLPLHFERSKVPVVTTGNAGAVRVRFLMTPGAIQTRNAFALGTTTHDVRDVTAPVIALLWIVCGGVTVDATRRD